MKYLVDTNIFIRFFVADNKKHFRECKKLIKKIKDEEIDIIIPSLVIGEISWVLQSFYKFSKDDILDCINAIKNLDSATFDSKEDLETALNLWNKYNIKFIDAMIASIDNVYEGKIQIISYDKDFDKIKEVKNVKPKDIL